MARKYLVNKITNEIWNCDNIDDTLIVEGITYIKVYNADPHYGNIKSTKLGNKEEFSEIITNEQTYESRSQLNG